MKIEFESEDNAAFQDGNRKIADQVENGQTEGVIHDLNGNRVGEWKS